MGFARIENDGITWAQRNIHTKAWKAEIYQDVLTINVVNAWLIHNSQVLTHATVTVDVSVNIFATGKGCKNSSIGRWREGQIRRLHTGEFNQSPGCGYQSDFISGEEHTIKLFALIGDGAYLRPRIVTQLCLFQADANVSGVATRTCTKLHIAVTAEDVTGLPTD